MSDYVRFYREQRTTILDRLSITDILALEDDELERLHGYVQWIFPMKTLSKAQPGAATQVLTDEAIREMVNDDLIMFYVDQVTGKMLGFWGIRWEERTEALLFVESQERFEEKLVRRNHNQLRMTRMLAFLSLVNRTALVQSLKELLENNVPASCAARRYWLGV
jgi:hypothetical protein